MFEQISVPNIFEYSNIFFTLWSDPCQDGSSSIANGTFAHLTLLLPPKSTFAPTILYHLLPIMYKLKSESVYKLQLRTR